MTRIICGVDVSSRTLDCRIGREGRFAVFPNTAEGIAQLAQFCREQRVELVAMEASGGYEQAARAGLSEEGFGVAVLNACAVRRFAQSMGWLEKTDKIDAGVIAWYAEVKRSRPVALPSPAQQHLRCLVTRLRQLTALQTAQRNQQRLVSDPSVQAHFAELLALVRRQIGELERAIAELLAEDSLWRELDQAFRSIKGVAARTVARLMAEMPEIGSLSHKTISKLAGLAPLADDSGQRQGKRAVRGGRAAVREILFIVASVVARYNADFLAFQQRLRALGKPPKVIRIALAHKLLIRLNAKARDVRQRLTSSAACTSTEKIAAAAAGVVGKRKTALSFSAFPPTRFSANT